MRIMETKSKRRTKWIGHDMGLGKIRAKTIEENRCINYSTTGCKTFATGPNMECGKCAVFKHSIEKIEFIPEREAITYELNVLKSKKRERI